MAEHISPTYANLQTAKVSAVLPAVGAWDTPLELLCYDFDFATFYISYTRGAAGGDVQFRVEYSPYVANVAVVEDWFLMSILAGGAVASGADTVSNIQREEIEYGSVAAAIQNFVWGPIELRGTAQRLRFSAQESGSVGNPGTLHAVVMFAES